MSFRTILGRGGFVLPVLAVALSTTTSPSLAQDSHTQEELNPIVIIGVTPMPGTGVPQDSIPASVQSLEDSDFEVFVPRNLTDLMEQRLTGVTIKDVQNSPYQQNVDYRGFTLSPLLGEPQGLAVYLDGVRINEAFGDSLQWDLIPEAAIKRIDLVSGNPVFGLNALGGALVIQTKRGLGWKGGEADLLYGSFGRVEGSIEAGASTDDTGAYIAIERGEDDGWRDFSDGEILRFFGDIGHQGDTFEIGLSLLKADTKLIGNGTTPEDLLKVRRKSVFTWPDITENDLVMGTARGSFEIDDGFVISALAYGRDIERDTVNGDEFDGEFIEAAEGGDFACSGSAPCTATDYEGYLVVGEVEGNEDERVVLFDTGGDAIQLGGDQGGITPGARNLSFTSTETRGGSFQLDGEMAGHLFVFGASYDQSDTTYRGHTLVGAIDADSRNVPAAVVDGAQRTIERLCALENFDPSDGTCDENLMDYEDANPLVVSSETTSLGFYASGTFSASDTTDITLSGRYDDLDLNLDLHDEAGRTSHSFSRFNPAIGISHALTREFILFGGYREASRAPTAAELSCADENAPCRLPNAFVADPPLEKVVARTIEVGARGRLGSVERGMAWETSLYGTVNRDDIIFIAVPGDQPGLGYFDNFGKTRRLGLDFAASGQNGKFDWFASYSWLRATYEAASELPGANHPLAINAGEDNARIEVRSGDRIPGLPDHTLKAGLGYRPFEGFRVGIGGVARSGVYLRGDESNQLARTSGYTIFNLTAEYRIGPLAIFGRVDNLFDTDYETFGILGECELEDGEEQCAGEVTINGHGLEGNVHHTNRFLSPGAPRGVFVGLRYSF